MFHIGRRERNSKFLLIFAVLGTQESGKLMWCQANITNLWFTFPRCPVVQLTYEDTMSGEQQPGCPSRESAVSTAAHSRSGVFQSSRKQNSFHFVFLLNWLRTQAFNVFALSVSRTFPSTVLSPGDQGSRVPKDMVLSRRVMAHLLLTCPSLLTRRINYFQFFLSIHPSYSPTQMFQFVSSKIT